MINDPMLQFFEYGHLPEPLQEVSSAFHELAVAIVQHLPQNPERTVALRKLLEAKDCAVRARIYKPAGGSMTQPNQPGQTNPPGGTPPGQSPNKPGNPNPGQGKPEEHPGQGSPTPHPEPRQG